jgi:hypothetical protein
MGCDGVPLSGLAKDNCGVCGGNGSSCLSNDKLNNDSGGSADTSTIIAAAVVIPVIVVGIVVVGALVWNQQRRFRMKHKYQMDVEVPLQQISQGQYEAAILDDLIPALQDIKVKEKLGAGTTVVMLCTANLECRQLWGSFPGELEWHSGGT